MKTLFDLIEYLDNNHHYAQSDEMMKIALDLSGVINEDRKMGNGAYGKFYSGFSNDEKNKIKNKLGPIHEEIGFKQFSHPDEDFNDNLKETLAFIYIAPYISANTDIKTPVYRGEISLSGIIANNIIPTQYMPGITLADAYRNMLPLIGVFATHKMEAATFDAIEEKLSSIGVQWNDLSSYNIKIDTKIIDECIKKHHEGTLDVRVDNLSKGAALFDFGHFKVEKSTPAGQNLQKLQESLNRINNNTLVNALKDAIQNILM